MIKQGIVDILPLALAVVPWGILTGALAIQVGLSPLQAQLLSLLVFAGAAQLSAITLLAGGAGTSAILGSVFVISSRHLLYSMVFRQHLLTQPLRWRLAIGFLLTDEMFAVSEAHTRRTGTFSLWFALSSGATFYLVWNLATAIGIVAGETLRNLDQLGLDFAIIATFIAMTFGELSRAPIVVAILTAGLTSVLLQPFLNDLYIVMAALLGMGAAYLAEGTQRDSNDG